MKSIKLYIPCIQQNKLLKKVYNNIGSSIKIKHKIDTIFVNSKNSEKTDSHRHVIVINSHKYIALSNLSIYYT